MSEVTKPILLDETGQSIVTKLDAIKDAITNRLPAGDPVRITVVTPPTTTEYTIGETVDLTGMVVSAIFSNNALIDITDQCTFSPAEGEVAVGDKITASWTWLPTGQTFTATTPIEVEYVTWASGTDAQIKAMVDAHYAGYIDLHDYWAVGDSRSVTLSAVTGDHSLDIDYGIDFDGEDVKLVLWNEGGKELSSAINDISECAFVVGLEKCLDFGSGYGNYDIWDGTHSTSIGGFAASPRRTWLNSTYRDSFSSTLKQIFKQHKNIAADGNSDNAVTSNDYFSLPSVVELNGTVTYGGRDYASATVESQNSQFEYFEINSNLLTLFRNNEGGKVWTRSPGKESDNDAFCYLYSSDNQNVKLSYHDSHMPFQLAPFGVI